LKDEFEKAKKNENIDKATVDQKITEVVGSSNTAEDPKKAEELLEQAKKTLGKSASEKAKTFNQIKRISFFYQTKNIKIADVKSAAIKEIFGSKVLGFVIFIFRWIFSKIFAGVAMKATAAGGVSAVGITPATPGKDHEIDSHTSKVFSLPINPNLPKEYTEYYSNKGMNIWEEHFPVSQLPEKLLTWAIEIYPQFKDRKEEIKNLQSFKSLVNTITERNKKYPDTTIIPYGYNRKIDLVNSFMKDFA
jgi:hypothetical protein